ncbi:MAG: proline--tRNA ligase, partial [Desulfobacterales bacterium]|nr:proline--tRNA ligase [Desulfobacterales bacterium]
KPEIHGGFAISGWCGSAACEARIKEELTVTIRCIPFEPAGRQGACIGCGKPGACVVFAKAY